MRTNVTISLDKRSTKKDGTHPLILRLMHYRETVGIPLGYSITPDEWDENERRIKGSCKRYDSIARINNLIMKKRTAAMDIVTRLEDEGTLKNLTAAEIKVLITGKRKTDIQESLPEEVNPKPTCFFAFTESLVADMRKADQIGNARLYAMVANALRKFHKREVLAFSEITYGFLQKYEIDYLARGNDINGLAVYTRIIRAIYNKGILSGLVDRAKYPFHDYKIKSTPTKKRALSKESLLKIVQAEVSQDDRLYHARNLFLASFDLWGMNYIDMAFLKVSSITDGRISYRRAKTKRHYDIKIKASLEPIIAFYVQGKGPDDFVFPIIKRATLAEQYKDVEWSRKYYNRDLRTLAKLCGVEEHLTSYVSRHSFATQAMLRDVPLNAISKMLGHSSLSTTQIYLKSLPSSILDDYNDLVGV